MDIFIQSSRDQKKVTSDYFYGVVFQDNIMGSQELARVRAIKLLFEPKVHTAWHTHPLGQTLFVLTGITLVGRRKKAPQIINAVDTVCG